MDRGLWYCVEQESTPSPRQRNAKKQNGCLRKTYKQLIKEEKLKAMKKRKYIHILIQSSKKIAKRDKKAFLSDQCKEIEGKNRMGKARDLFKKMRCQGNILCEDGHGKETETLKT